MAGQVQHVCPRRQIAHRGRGGVGIQEHGAARQNLGDSDYFIAHARDLFVGHTNQYRLLEVSTAAAGGPDDGSRTQKAADIKRDLTAYDDTITQDYDRRQFTELVALWQNYADLHGAIAAEGASKIIDALLVDMIEWNRLEGVRSIQKADLATRAAGATGWR